MKTVCDYEIGRRVFDSEGFSESHAVELGSGREVRIIQFADSLSANETFRAEFRRDLPTLKNLKHFHILPVLDWGESGGQLFYSVQLPEGIRLADDPVNQLTWDQLVDLAWQLSSAIQHAHNVGISHGRISRQSVFVSPGIRLQVGGFAVQRWIDVVEGTRTDTVSQFETDTQQIAEVVSSLFPLVGDSEVEQLLPLRQLLDAARDYPNKLTARDIQRRLGAMLMRGTENNIDLVDDRSGQALSRRSLVDELFDDLPQKPTGGLDDYRIARPSIFMAIVCVGTLLILLAVGIWLAMK